MSKEWKPYISSVFQRIIGEKDLAVAVCAPIFDEKGKAIGILGTAQRTDFLGRIIHQVKLDAENKITLVDQMGQIIYSDRLALEKRVISYPFVDLINKAITEKKDDLEIQDPHESSNVRYTAFVPIKGFGWSVIVEREKRSVLRSEFEYFFQLAFLSTLLFLFIAISLAFFRKQFIHRQTVVLLNTEKEMREKERRYSSLLENINMIAVGMDTDGNITFANPFLLKLTGYALEEVIGRSWFDTFLLEREREVLKGVFQEILLKGFHPHPDNPILTKSGDERLIAWNNTILKDIHGQVLGMMSIGEDITGRKRIEEEREKLVRDLQKALSEVKMLKGILPICASCKKIRDDKGYWRQIEAYIRDHSEAEFSHSFCPDFMEKVYGDIPEEEDISRKK